MKVAVLYFGVPRNTAVCMPSIHSKIIDPLRSAGFSVTERFHLFMQSEVNNVRSKESGSLSGRNYDYFQNLNGIVESISIEKFNIQLNCFRMYGDPWEDEFRSTRNLLMQLHSLRQVTELFVETDCDAAIFVRPDIFYLDEIDARSVSRISRASNFVALPSWQWHNGMNDRIAVCSRDAAIVYGSRGEVALDYCKKLSVPLHAERLLAYSLSQARANVRILDVRAERVRIDGRHEAENFDSYTTAGGRKAKIQLSLILAKSGMGQRIRFMEIPKREARI